MSYINNVNGDINATNTVGNVEIVIVDGYTSIVTATAQIQHSNVTGKLGIALITENDHNKLKNRDLPDQHTIDSITGLRKELDNAGKVKDVLVNGESVLDKEGKVNISVPDVSQFITKTVNDLSNYYLKNETYTKEEVNRIISSITSVSLKKVDTLPTTGESNVIYLILKEGSTNDVYNEFIYIDNDWELIGSTQINLTGFATEDFVRSVLPTFNIDFNLLQEGNNVMVYTNTGDIVDDNHIRLQLLPETGTTGINKSVYTDAEINVIYDGSNKIRRAVNGIDFDIINLPYACKSMFYNPNSKKVFGLANGYFIYSDDNGKTWNAIQSSYANNADFISRAQSHVAGFAVVNKSTKTINCLGEDFRNNSSIKSAIVPEFVTQFSQYQFIWCNSSGTFKYGAGSSEGSFASLTGVTVNMLKTVNGRQIVGLKNSNKLYIIKNLDGVSGNGWVEYILPDVCTVNDIIYNSNDETYYIFTDVNTYYKTKDFDTFESINKDGLRGLQGHFTLAGIQMTTSNHNELLLAPTMTKNENRLQEIKRSLNKFLWAGAGLGTDGIEIFVNGSTYIGVNSSGVYLKQLDEYAMPESVVKANKVATAKLVKGLFDPYNMDNWFWNEGYPMEESTIAHKMIFAQEGSFYDPQSYNEEYSVEQYEYGCLYTDTSTGLSTYEKLGNLAWLFNLILGG